MDLPRALTQLGAIPNSVDAAGHSEFESKPVIRCLAESWCRREHQTTGAANRKAERISRWLQQQITRGSTAELLTPTATDGVLERDFGARLLWWPRGKPDGRRIAIVSSRIGRKFHERPEWFETLRLATATLRDHDSLVSAEGTTTHRFVSQLAMLLKRHHVEVKFASPRRSVGRWFEWLMSIVDDSSEEMVWPVFVSPRVPAEPEARSQKKQNHKAIVSLPEQDVAVSLLADQSWVLSLQKSGAIQSLLETGLSDSTLAPGSVRLLCGDGLVDSSLARSLQEQGAVCWYLTSTDPFEPDNAANPQNSDVTGIHSTRQFEPSVSKSPLGKNWHWLTHCTRGTSGVWPGEKTTRFVEDLLLSDSGDRSPLGALHRILQQETLVASSDGIRGGLPVVCFSESPLEQLLERRRWRKHRTRWDFEPYGICIDRDALERLGAAPVRYGDEELWCSLAEQDRPWFQQRFSQVGTRAVDWSTEKEWRISGDLDLSQFSVDDAFVFVSRDDEAHELQPHSRWPVRVAARK